MKQAGKPIKLLCDDEEAMSLAQLHELDEARHLRNAESRNARRRRAQATVDFSEEEQAITDLRGDTPTYSTDVPINIKSMIT